MTTEQVVLMIGPALDAPGGMSAVARSYSKAGFFDKWNVRYLDSYTQPSWRVQLRVYGRVLFTLFRLLLSGHVALVHLHSASRGSFFRKALLAALAGMFRTPVVFHVHSGEISHWVAGLPKPARWFVVRTLQKATCVLALTPSWAEKLRLLAPKSCVHSLPNPVALPSALRRPRQPRRRILFLGRIRQKKGAFDLIHAMPAVWSRVADAELVLAGDGELEQGQQMVDALGPKRGQVQFTGWIDGIEKETCVANADIFVLPSYFEGLPVGVLEAMAHGLVVVTTPVGGIPDVVQADAQALIVQPGDVQGLADALVKALTDDALASRLVQSAWSRVQIYDSAIVLDALNACYEAVLGAKPLPTGRR